MENIIRSFTVSSSEEDSLNESTKMNTTTDKANKKTTIKKRKATKSVSPPRKIKTVKQGIEKKNRIYTASSSDEDSSNGLTELNKKNEVRKHEQASKSVSPTKKVKKTSYLDAFNQCIKDEEDINEETVNTMSTRQNDRMYTYKLPGSIGDDYWCLQHYKGDAIKDVPVNERWKHSSCTIKLHTKKNGDIKDVEIAEKFNKLIEQIVFRFTSDPKRKVTKRRCTF